MTNFVDKLQKAIAMQPAAGKSSAGWITGLNPNASVDETLRRRILDSACILAFMSPRYLGSEWCRGGDDHLASSWSGGGQSNNRVFLVELKPTDRKQWHPGVQSISEIKFWSVAA